MQTLKMWVFLILAIACVSSIAHTLWWLKTSDDLLDAVFARAETTTLYSQHVETTLVLPDRILKIQGIYGVDRENGVYNSFSTTTLHIPDIGEKVFTTHNIATPNIIFLKLETEDPFLKETIATTPWTSFPPSQIPNDFFGIANSGPILDNLLLLGESGKYLRLKERANEETLDGKDLVHYIFNTSGKIPDKETGGPLPALLERITRHGTVEIWADKEMASVHKMLLRNEDGYTSEILFIEGEAVRAAPVE